MSRVKLARCILLATAAFYAEFMILAPFGAAILCTALMLTFRPWCTISF